MYKYSHLKVSSDALIIFEMFLLNSVDWTMSQSLSTVRAETEPRRQRSKVCRPPEIGLYQGTDLGRGTKQPFGAQSQDSEGVALGQVCECPWVAQSRGQPDRISLERPQLEIPQIHMCQAHSVTPKKTWSLDPFTTAKGSSTKYCVKGVDTYVHAIFQFLFLIIL